MCTLLYQLSYIPHNRHQTVSTRIYRAMRDTNTEPFYTPLQILCGTRRNQAHTPLCFYIPRSDVRWLINIAHSDILCDHVPDFNIDSILLWTCNMPVRLIWFLLPCGGYAAGTYQRKILTSFLTLPAYRDRTCHFCPRIKYGWAFLSIETYAGTLREEFFRYRNYIGIVRVWICTTHEPAP